MVRPTKQQILRAAKYVVIEQSFYACNALKSACGYDNHLGLFSGANEFKKFYNIHTDTLNDYTIGWFGNPSIEENQLARSLALLLYAEARNDVLVGRK